MGLFKSKDERRIEREMRIRQGVRAIEKSIRQQEKFSEDFIKNARHAQQIGDKGQYEFIRGALKKTAAVKKILERQLLSIKNAMLNTVPPCISTNCFAACIVPPVARRSSANSTFAPGTNASACMCSSALPYSRS